MKSEQGAPTQGQDINFMEELIVAKAVRLAGGSSQVARDLEISQPHAVGRWVAHNRVPPYRIIPLEKLTKGLVSRQELDPVLYPPET